MKLMVLRAFELKKALEMYYIKDNNQVSQRTVDVLSITGETFVAYCRLRKAKRTFKIDNILAAATVNPNKFRKGA